MPILPRGGKLTAKAGRLQIVTPYQEQPSKGRSPVPLTEVSIRRPLFVSMALLFFVLLGAISYSRLGLEQYPQASAPFVLVMTPYPGASPEEVESSLTRPLEDAVAGANELKNLYSVSMDGVSIV